MSSYYIASCVFTSQFPDLSFRVQEYVTKRFDMPVVRCCVPRYKIREFEDRMPEGEAREKWRQLPDSASFVSGDDVYSLCHNCNNIIEEMHPGVKAHSLWELIDQDDRFSFPAHFGMIVTVQDCWRSRDRSNEQRAVRSLLKKMNIEIAEAPLHHGDTEFCGCSLYRAQPPRNPKFAPKHYVEQAAGKFIPHTLEEQQQIMRDYCTTLTTKTVVCYCHYCLEGLLAGGTDGRHMAQLLFASEL